MKINYKIKKIIYLVIVTIVWMFLVAIFMQETRKNQTPILAWIILMVLWSGIIEFTKNSDKKDENNKDK